MIALPKTSALLVALACLGPLQAYSIQDDKAPLSLREDLSHPLTHGGSRITWSLYGAAEDDYGYGEDNGYISMKGPETWPEKFPTCAGKRQSPINIDLNDVDEESSEEGNRLRFRNYDALPIDLDLTNNGHSVAMTGNWKSTPSISGFVLDGDYVLADVHFHWGRNAREGSEHLVNGHSYPLEMHLVHFKKDYGNIAEAITKEDGLAVLAYFFKVHHKRNHDLQRLLDEIDSVITPGIPAPIRPFRLEKFAPSIHRNFVSYFGSLTTPLCNQVVRWIVNLKPLHVSLKQLSQFRRVKDEEGKRLVENFRPPQPLNHRRVVFVP